MQRRKGPFIVHLEPFPKFMVFHASTSLKNPAPPSLFVIGCRRDRKEMSYGYPLICIRCIWTCDRDYKAQSAIFSKKAKTPSWLASSSGNQISKNIECEHLRDSPCDFRDWGELIGQKGAV
jgi:hypothetical protein